MTTCPVVCAAAADDCPTKCVGNTTLCASGSCEETCPGIDESPCGCPNLPIACPKVVDYYDECFVSFQRFYDSNTECEAEQQSAIPPMSYTGPYFIFGYGWVGTVTILVIGWCYFNEKLCPCRETTCVSVKVNSTSKNIDGVVWTQTGYKRTVPGTLIYVLVLLTCIGFQFALFTLIILFYVQVGSITRWAPVFNDVEHVNTTFILVWAVGFPWTMAFRFIGTGIDTLFLRRCRLQEASHVAICTPTTEAKHVEQTSGSEKLIKLAARFVHPIARSLRAIFSYPHGLPGYDVSFCPVRVEPISGKPSLYYHLRKYVWEESTGAFVEGRISVGEKLHDFSNQRQGLRHSEVIRRAETVGPNETTVVKPTLMRSLYTEFSKGFYVYQVCILWALFACSLTTTLSTNQTGLCCRKTTLTFAYPYP
jgi:hypothetical protein